MAENAGQRSEQMTRILQDSGRLLSKQLGRPEHPRHSEDYPMPRDPKDPKMRDGESSLEEMIDIENGVDLDTTKKEEEIHKEFGDQDEPAA